MTTTPQTPEVFTEGINSTWSTLKTHFVFWLGPSLFLLACACVYFLDPYGMSSLIAPELNREFGLLEHIQLILILAIVFVAFAQSRSVPTRFERLFFAVVGIFAFFILLEEIDYGIHYWELLQTNTIAENATGEFEGRARNIHNQGEMRTYIMFQLRDGWPLAISMSNGCCHRTFTLCSP